MKIEQPFVLPVVNSGAVRETKFNVEINSKAFAFLSSGLYSNSIYAIVREIGHNARDSHIVSGKRDIPFEVHLPNALEPWFSVKDQGIGLTTEEVEVLFTTMFKSTKENCDDQTGALGLGCKSPFTYTNNFSVFAVKDGIAGSYAAYMNQEGFPTLTTLAVAASDQPNGVEVRVPVENAADYVKFAQAVSDVYAWMDVKPIITNSDVKINNHYESLMQISENCWVGKGWSDRYNDHSYAVMGGVAYPINANDLINALPSDSIQNNDVRLALTVRSVLHFELGALTFLPSREGLRYNEKTVNALVAQLVELANLASDNLRAEVLGVKNLWGWSQIKQRINSNHFWTQVFTRCKQKFPEVEAHLEKLEKSPVTFEEGETIGTKTGYELEFFYVDYRRKKSRLETIRDLCPKSIKVLICDGTEKSYTSRIMNYVRTVDTKVSYLIVATRNKQESSSLLTLLRHIRRPPRSVLVNLNKVAPFRTAPRDRSSKKDIPKVFSIVRGHSSYYTKSNFCWHAENSLPKLQPGTRGFYVNLKALTIEPNDYSISSVKDLGKILDGGTRVYGVRAGAVIPEGWVNFFDYLAELKTSHLTSLAEAAVYDSNIPPSIKYSAASINIGELTKPKLHSDLTNPAICAILRNTDEYSKALNAASDKWSDFNKKYPLLKHLNYNASVEAIQQYINLINKE